IRLLLLNDVLLGGLLPEILVKSPCLQEMSYVIYALETRPFKIFKNESHPLVSLQKLSSPLPGIPLWLERRQKRGDFAEVDTVVALIRSRIPGKLDATAGHG